MDLNNCNGQGTCTGREVTVNVTLGVTMEIALCECNEMFEGTSCENGIYIQTLDEKRRYSNDLAF